MAEKIYKSAAELIGNTPILELVGIKNKTGVDARLLAKLEAFNPAGSVKDRIAKAMIEDAEQKGILRPGGTIIEPTSGNTGIALSSIAAAKGYRMIVVMPDTMSMERRQLIQAYGAELVLTPGSQGMKGAIAKAEELANEIPGAILAGQFINPANPAIHKKTTGPEIFADTAGEIDIFVSGVGTGGTISGVGEYLKSVKPSVKIVAVEPKSSPVLSGGEPGSHKIQGIGAGFVPVTLNMEVVDEVLQAPDEEAFKMSALLGKTQGILAGISAGATLWGMAELAKRPENKGRTILGIFPDNGERYLSTGLYKGD